MSAPTPEQSAIDRAARWLAAETSAPHPIIPALKARFGLTAAQAVEAIRQSHYLGRAAA